MHVELLEQHVILPAFLNTAGVAGLVVAGEGVLDQRVRPAPIPSLGELDQLLVGKGVVDFATELGFRLVELFSDNIEKC